MSKITDVRIFGINESKVAAGYPMRTEIGDINEDIKNQKYPKAINNLATCRAGSGDDNFLKGIIVQFNLTFSLKAWLQAERYNWLDFVSSCSTMHCITKMDIRSQCNKYVWKTTIDQLEGAVKHYNSIENKNTEEAKEMFLNIIYNIPSGFELTARMTTNYLQLKTIYAQRRHHKLPCWQMFCDWIEELPKSEWITGKKK